MTLDMKEVNAFEITVEEVADTKAREEFAGNISALEAAHRSIQLWKVKHAAAEKHAELLLMHLAVAEENIQDLTDHARRWEAKAEEYRANAIKFGDERDVASALLEGAGILTEESRTLVERIESVLRLIGDGDREIDRLRKELARAQDNYACMMGKMGRLEAARDDYRDKYLEMETRAERWEDRAGQWCANATDNLKKLDATMLERDEALTSRDTIDKAAECLLEQLGRAEKDRDEAQKNYAFMVERAANEKLDGYRELGARAAAAENSELAIRRRIWAVAQTLIDEVGAEGPTDAERAAEKAVEVIRSLRVKCERHQILRCVCAHCSADLLESDAPPHFPDCVVTEEDAEDWQDALEGK